LVEKPEESMTLEEAIKTAIDYEIKVRDAYLGSLDNIKDETGRKVFEVLGNEEQGHVDFLEAKLAEWQKTGHVEATRLETVVPAKAMIDKGVAKLDDHLAKRDYGTELEMLRKALALEQETSRFYQKMVAEMKEEEEGALFKRFLEIEEGHQAIVQAEIDYLTGTGNFFNFEEFNLEH
jgi:rubrerythrin